MENCNNNNLDGSYISDESLSKAKRKAENKDNESNKRLKSDVDDVHVCNTCQSTFVNSSNLRHHIESYHVKNNSWSCAQCGKLFSSKSNLKVHLRVHTRIRPYHCKYCAYSCMHHSSIREHLTKIHPDYAHNSNCPGYVYNGSAVPNPEDFNSTTFDKQAFINEAKVANDKLSAHINSFIQSNTPSPPIVNSQQNIFSNIQFETPISISPSSSSDNDVEPKPRRKAKSKKLAQSINSTELDDSSSSNKSTDQAPQSQKIYNPFSIDSIINTPKSESAKPSVEQQTNYDLAANLYSQWNAAAAWLYANQMMYKMMYDSQNNN